MTATTRRRTLSKESREQLKEARARAASSGTELHGTFIEALRLMPGELSEREHQALRPMYRTIACAALRLFHDLLGTGGIKLQVEGAGELMFWAWKELRREAGFGENDARDLALMLDWIGKERFRYLMEFSNAAYELEAADKAKAVSDAAIERLRAAMPAEIGNQVKVAP